MATIWHMRGLFCLALALVSACKRDERVDPLVAEAQRCAKTGAEIACPRPIFSVDNLKAAQAYYRDALGFKVEWEHGEPPDFGAVSRSNLVLFMCQRCQSTPGAWVWTFTQNVDSLHEELVKRHAIIRMPPTDMPWGQREMQVADPDGNVIRFASPLDHH